MVIHPGGDGPASRWLEKVTVGDGLYVWLTGEASIVTTPAPPLRR
jgi:NADPH-dependent ferric siderophore reductase